MGVLILSPWLLKIINVQSQNTFKKNRDLCWTQRQSVKNLKAKYAENNFGVQKMSGLWQYVQVSKRPLHVCVSISVYLYTTITIT